MGARITPVVRLTSKIAFPPVHLATPEGIIAVGGDLSPERLICAYRQGIFPWYSEGEPIVWWSPDPRFVLFPQEIQVSGRLQRFLKKNIFRCSFDRDFVSVITHCRQIRKDGLGTWITDDMKQAYCRLHELGHAHSVEVWLGDELAGGLYGVALGSCFFAESMFYQVSNASKAALIWLGQRLEEKHFSIIDCQIHTPHVARMGGRFIHRQEYLRLLKDGVDKPVDPSCWR